LRISTSLSSACAVTYVAQQKNIGLSNDAGTGYTGYVTPGQAGSVSNSQCTLSGAGSSISPRAMRWSLTVSLQFNVAFCQPLDERGEDHLRQSRSTRRARVLPVEWYRRDLTIPKAGLPTIVSLSPSSGHGHVPSVRSDCLGSSRRERSRFPLSYCLRIPRLEQSLCGHLQLSAKDCGVNQRRGALECRLHHAWAVRQPSPTPNARYLASGRRFRASGSSLIMTVNLQLDCVRQHWERRDKEYLCQCCQFGRPGWLLPPLERTMCSATAYPNATGAARGAAILDCERPRKPRGRLGPCTSGKNHRRRQNDSFSRWPNRAPHPISSRHGGWAAIARLLTRPEYS